MRNFWFFFYGLPNVFGLGMALIGLLLQLALVFSEINLASLLSIDPSMAMLLWLPICMLLYALGWLTGWWVQDNDANLQFEQTVNAQQIETALHKLTKQVDGRIPADAYQHVKSIEDSVMAVLPHLISGQFANQDLYTVKQAVFDYLPTTLEHYLRLPTPYANYHVITDGKTAKTILIEQLATLDNSLKDITHSIFQNDAQKLLANQRFLQTRLGTHESNHFT